MKGGNSLRGTLIVALLRLLARLPLAASQALGAALGWLAWALPGASRRIARANLDLCLPGTNAGERRRLTRRTLMETGKTITETAAIWFWDWARVRALMVEVPGEAEVDAARAGGRGLILATPHFGCWELAGLYIASRYPCTILYRPLRLPELEPLVRGRRERLGAHMVPAGARGVRALYQALERGEVVGLLPDQEPRAGGVFAPFFGVPAYTMTLLARLAHRTGAAVFVGACERLPRGRGYRLVYRPVPAPGPDTTVEETTAALNAVIEAAVRAHPEQYQWAYKRFRQRPPGLPRVY